MTERIQRVARTYPETGPARSRHAAAGDGTFGAMLEKRLDDTGRGGAAVNFSKHALARAEERGIELSPALMDKLADSVERAQEKGATNILALGDTQAFIINIPYNRVITMMSQDEMRENIFTNIDGAVLL